MKATARCALGVFVLACAASASADPVFLASSYDTLYRVSNGQPIESFTYDVKLRAMYRDELSGEVYAFGDQGGHAPASLYRIDDPLGTPTLDVVCSFDRFYGSVTQIGDQLYGFSTGLMYRIDVSDPDNVVETFVGHTGVSNTAGAAYDPGSGTLYMMSYTGSSDALYRVNTEDASAEYVTSLGVNGLDYGAEYYDEQFYATVQNSSSGQVEIGLIDVETGDYTMTWQLASGVAPTATGLTIIPEPATAMLLLAAALLLRRR